MWDVLGDGTVISRARLSKLEQVTDKLRLMARDDKSSRSTIGALEVSADEAKRNLQRSQTNVAILSGVFWFVVLPITGMAILSATD